VRFSLFKQLQLPVYSLLAMFVLRANFGTSFLAGMPNVIAILATTDFCRAGHKTLLKQRVERLMLNAKNDRNMNCCPSASTAPFVAPVLAASILRCDA
jgi:hypothetical protein